jgi:hypothetical protein
MKDVNGRTIKDGDIVRCLDNTTDLQAHDNWSGVVRKDPTGEHEFIMASPIGDYRFIRDGRTEIIWRKGESI